MDNFLTRHIHYLLPHHKKQQKISLITISKRNMIANTNKIIKCLGPHITKRPMSSFSVTGRKNSYQPTQDHSKTGHKTIYKQECNAEKCQSTNCSNTHKECDQESKKVFAVGHKTHDDKNASSTSKTVAFENDNGPRGPAKCVLYAEKEPVKDDQLYEDYDYKASKLLQKDENTQKLNELTKNQKSNKQHDHDKE